MKLAVLFSVHFLMIPNTEFTFSTAAVDIFFKLSTTVPRFRVWSVSMSSDHASIYVKLGFLCPNMHHFALGYVELHLPFYFLYTQFGQVLLELLIIFFCSYHPEHCSSLLIIFEHFLQPSTAIIVCFPPVLWFLFLNQFLIHKMTCPLILQILSLLRSLWHVSLNT